MVASAFTVAAVQLLVPGAAATCCTPMQHQPPHHGADFDQLKHDLVLAVDNHDITGALELVSKLENSTMTKEILESTRLGGTINEIRKKLSDAEPDLAKRCRALIKRWQKLIDFNRPSSIGGSSSNNTTPSLVSPAIRSSRGVTPRTPVAPSFGGLKTDTNISPGYAPKKISPLAELVAKNIHKSQSVGTDLNRRAVEKSRSPETKANGDNGTLEPLKLTIKRAAVTPDVNGIPMKRSKTSATNLDHVQELIRESKTSSPSPVQSVTAARKNVQSTTELVAQLTENYPQHMTIDLSEHQRRANMIEQQQPKIVPPMTILRSSLPDSIPQARQKRKYTKKHQRFFKNGQLPTVDENASFESTSTMPEENEDELDETAVVEIDEEPSVSEPIKEDVKKLKKEEEDEKVEKKAKEGRKSAFDWFKKLSLDSLLGDRLPEHAEPSEDRRTSYVMQIRQREVLCLPIVDIGMPDFLEYNYPNPDQFIADRNKGPPVPQRMP